jgi:Putative zinc-finger
MRCERLDDLLPAYLDGDLPSRLNGRVSAHLEACARCRGELAAQQRALRLLDAGRHSVSIDLWADFSRRLQTQRPPSPTPWRWLGQPGLAAAVAATVVALVALTSPRPRPPESADGRTGFTRVALAPVGEISPLQKAVTPLAQPHQKSRPAAPSVRQPEQHDLSFGRPARRLHGLVLQHTGAAIERRPRRHSVRQRNAGPGGHRMIVQLAWVPARRSELTPSPRELESSPPAPVAPASLPSHNRVQANARAASLDRSPTGVSPRQARTGDPLRIADALVSVEEDAASDQIKGELLRMAREVARVGGETGTDEGERASGMGERAPGPNPASDEAPMSNNPQPFVTDSTGG